MLLSVSLHVLLTQWGSNAQFTEALKPEVVGKKVFCI
jgi:hypothetical protein